MSNPAGPASSRRDLLSAAAASLVAGSAASAAAAQDAPAPFAGGALNLLDFIPASEHAAIRSNRSTTDVARYFRAAVAEVDSRGGGELYVPAGTYRCGSPVDLCRNLLLRGAGIASNLEFTHAGRDVPSGSCLRSVWPSNGANQVHITLADLCIRSTNGSNRGAQFYDNCGMHVTLQRVTMVGGRFGAVLDQSEIVLIQNCHFAGHLAGGAAIWIVNGADITPGNQGGFTNVITIDHGCQFDEQPAFAIVDDGGECHYIGSNNVNGGGFRFAGVGNLTIMGGEYEGVNGRPTMHFSHLTRSGNGVGACHAIVANGLIVQPGGLPCIQIDSMYSLILLRMNMTANPPALGCVQGMNNLGGLFARLNINPNTPVPLFDTYASTGHDDGYLPIFQVASTSVALPINYVNAHVQTMAASPVTVTLPAHATVAFPVGTRVEIEQFGTGRVTISPARGVTLNGTAATTAQYQVLTLTKTSRDHWIVARTG